MKTDSLISVGSALVAVLAALLASYDAEQTTAGPVLTTSPGAELRNAPSVENMSLEERAQRFDGKMNAILAELQQQEEERYTFSGTPAEGQADPEQFETSDTQ